MSDVELLWALVFVTTGIFLGFASFIERRSKYQAKQYFRTIVSKLR